MLRIDLAAVRESPVAVAERILPDAALPAESGLVLAAPLEVSGRLSAAGEDRFYWQARIETVVREECRRCLKPVDVPVAVSAGLMFAIEGVAAADDGDCYIVPRRATALDLAPAVREELLLAVPQYVECRADCRGLCPRCGADLNAGPCGCAPQVDPRWEALTKLARGD